MTTKPVVKTSTAYSEPLPELDDLLDVAKRKIGRERWARIREAIENGRISFEWVMGK